MELFRAERLIRQCTYKPGWRFEASPYSQYRETLQVFISASVANSNVVWAPDYRQAITRRLEFFIFVGDCDTPEDLYNKLFKCVMDIEEHESREFFSTDSSYSKPFHPHTMAGIVNWANRKEITAPVNVSEEPVLVFKGGSNAEKVS